MKKDRRSIGLLMVLGLVLALVAAACGGSSATNAPNGVTGTNGTNGANGTGLSAGLSANLDSLTSYQFSETMAGSSSGVAASPGSSDSFLISGTVVNKPTSAIKVNDLGIWLIDIGGQEWTSMDGTSWTGPVAGDTNVTDLLPTTDYATWFDTNANGFTVAGEETKNGVDCVHYKGNSSLGSLYSGVVGVSANFQADLWVAKAGNYPVSGVYGYTASAGGQSGSFGFSFDITHINDAANVVSPPANSMAIPT
jgi:hypothetical protein